MILNSILRHHHLVSLIVSLYTVLLSPDFSGVFKLLNLLSVNRAKNFYQVFACFFFILNVVYLYSTIDYSSWKYKKEAIS